MKKKVLLTGATGFLGNVFIRAYGGEFDIFALTRRPDASFQGLAHPVLCDLSREFDVSQLPEDIDAVVHLSQSRHYREFPEKADDIFSVNVTSTLRLLEYARKTGVRKFILASTGSVYGGGEQLLSEQSPIHPPDFYAKTKWMAEQLVRQYQDYFSTIILRFFFIYGDGKGIVSSLWNQIRTGNPVLLHGENGLRLNPIHVADAAECVRKSLNLKQSTILNIAGKDQTSIRAIAEALAAASGHAVKFEKSELTERHYLADIQQMNHVLQFQPEIFLAEGIQKAVDAESSSLTH